MYLGNKQKKNLRLLSAIVGVLVIAGLLALYTLPFIF